MKNLALTVMGLVVAVLVFSACSGYDDELIIDPQQPEQTPNNPEKNDNNDDDEWETVMDSWYEMINSYSIIDSYIKTNKKESYNVQAPFSASLGKDLYFCLKEKDTPMSAYISLAPVSHMNTSYGEWYSNNENDSIREVSTSQEYKCNLYTRSLVIKNAQAYRLINGQREVFEMPTIVSSFAGHSSDVEQIERNDSIFDRETIKDSVRIAFSNRADIAPFYVSAKTVIDHFVDLKEQNETMPEPTFWVEGEILYISSRTASPIYKNYSKKDQGADWFEVNVIHTTVKTYTVANGQLKDSYDNSELADAKWNSCVYDAGYTNKWVPCTLTPNNGGWVYTLQFADGTYRGMDVPMNQACIDGLKSFEKDHNAAQTPFLDSAAAVKKTYSNGVLWSVNKNGLYSFTVAAK